QKMCDATPARRKPRAGAPHCARTGALDHDDRRSAIPREESMFSKTIRIGAFVALLASPATVQAASLNVVTVAAPDVNCVFDPSCKLVVTDSVGDILIPNMKGGILQSRTFSGAAGAPGAGLTGYDYRIDLTQ